MDIMVIGSGGREHALIQTLKQSPAVGKIYCLPGNGGIGEDAVCVPIKAMDLDGCVNFALQNKIGFAVVAPDDPLAAGMVDALEAKGIPAFGPTKAAAQIEASKVFSKNLMRKYHIPTAAFEAFEDAGAAIAYIEAQGSFPIVIKADGLALGKGVIIAQSMQEAKDAVHAMMEESLFGESGRRIVVEEFMTGPEVSVLAFTDSKTVVPMVSSMDHKRAFDGDEGPNTGGMGVIAPNPHYTAEIADLCMERIFLPTIKAMNAEGRPFKGCLYFGLMLTPKGPRVIEYNCRFGDPEAQAVLPLLKTDLYEILTAVRDERLSEIKIEWEDAACACVVMASGGYPGKYQTGKAIHGLAQFGGSAQVSVYHAGTVLEDGAYKTAGGRVLGVCAKGGTLAQALAHAYAAVGKISFEGAHYRRDIGQF